MKPAFRIVLNLVLFLSLAGIALSSWLLRTQASNTNYEFIPDMVHSARYMTFSANPNFPDGKTLHQPPLGTISRGHLPLHYSASQADAVRAGDELINPVGSGTENSLLRGSRVFTNFCAVCHGADGSGMGPVAQRGFPPPPSLFLPHALQMNDGQMFHVLTYGQNNMPSYASQLGEGDRWNVITYIRSMQAAAAVKLKTAQTMAAQAGTVAKAGGK